jgi:pyruvate ferredoxin oxidoreductase alpha subunit
MKKTNLKQKNKQILEGSRAIALTINNISPDVISAYPITPQTHIVEDLAKFKANGKANYEYIRAESEFAAASIVLGAVAAGSRSYSATSSQGLLLMTEVLYNISGMRLPLVITCANRAVSAPINIWSDHSDAMALRDSGFMQFFAENHQEAIYQHILAYKIAEKLNLPAMVNVDGFILTHSYEEVIIPSKREIKKYLPSYRPEPGTYLNPKNPVTLGGFYPPEHYRQTRENLFSAMQESALEIKKEWKKLSNHFNYKTKNNGLVEYTGKNKVNTIIVAMGSIIGTIKEVIKNNSNVGVIKITSFRPFPASEIKKLTNQAKNIIIIEKAISLGNSGPLGIEVKAALQTEKHNIKNYIGGLGGSDITEKQIKKIIHEANKKSNETIFIS